MNKTNEALCRYCRTLAMPICECGLLATKHTKHELVIFSDDLSMVSLTYVWKDNDGILKWLEETDLLSKAKTSTIYDIQFTKD